MNAESGVREKVKDLVLDHPSAQRSRPGALSIFNTRRQARGWAGELVEGIQSGLVVEEKCAAVHGIRSALGDDFDLRSRIAAINGVIGCGHYGHLAYCFLVGSYHGIAAMG